MLNGTVNYLVTDFIDLGQHLQGQMRSYRFILAISVFYYDMPRYGRNYVAVTLQMYFEYTENFLMSVF